MGGCISADNFSQQRNAPVLVRKLQEGKSQIELSSNNPFRIESDVLIIPFTPNYEIDKNVFDYYGLLPDFRVALECYLNKVKSSPTKRVAFLAKNIKTAGISSKQVILAKNLMSNKNIQEAVISMTSSIFKVVDDNHFLTICFPLMVTETQLGFTENIYLNTFSQELILHLKESKVGLKVYLLSREPKLLEKFYNHIGAAQAKIQAGISESGVSDLRIPQATDVRPSKDSLSEVDPDLVIHEVVSVKETNPPQVITTASNPQVIPSKPPQLTEVAQPTAVHQAEPPTVTAEPTVAKLEVKMELDDSGKLLSTKPPQATQLEKTQLVEDQLDLPNSKVVTSASVTPLSDLFNQIGSTELDFTQHASKMSPPDQSQLIGASLGKGKSKKGGRAGKKDKGQTKATAIQADNQETEPDHVEETLHNTSAAKAAEAGQQVEVSRSEGEPGPGKQCETERSGTGMETGGEVEREREKGGESEKVAKREEGEEAQEKSGETRVG